MRVGGPDRSTTAHDAAAGGQVLSASGAVTMCGRDVLSPSPTSPLSHTRRSGRGLSCCRFVREGLTPSSRPSLDTFSRALTGWCTALRRHLGAPVHGAAPTFPTCQCLMGGCGDRAPATRTLSLGRVGQARGGRERSHPAGHSSGRFPGDTRLPRWTAGVQTQGTTRQTCLFRSRIRAPTRFTGRRHAVLTIRAPASASTPEARVPGAAYAVAGGAAVRAERG
jgi:hypothetical protein